jgi:phosphoesterase RecJ-like protein
MTEALENVSAALLRGRRFVLTTHVNPDGDGLGSELALARFLRGKGKTVTILNHSATPKNYAWMDPAGELVAFVPERDRDILLQADTIVVLDTNHPERLRSLQPFVTESAAVKIVIDHHLEPHPFADQYLIDDDATSTGELVYRLLAHIDAAALDSSMAVPLYTAIMTDTGAFRYPRTDPEIHRIAAHLLELGVTPIEVYANVYEDWTPGRMRLLGEVLDSMKTAHNGKVAYVVCTRKMFQDTGTSEVDTDNFTSYPMSVRGVVVGILINELQHGVKISFRSKGTIPINELAKEFGGNGHLNAAGARLFDATVDQAVATVIEKSGKYVAGPRA